MKNIGSVLHPVTKHKILLAWALLGIGLALNGAGMQQAAADHINSPEQIPAGIKSQISSYDAINPAPAEKYALYRWISTDTNPSNNQSITVPAGTTSITLQLNSLVFLHNSLVNKPLNGAVYSSPLPQDSSVNSTAQNAQLVSRTSINSVSVSISNAPAGTPTGSVSGPPSGTVMTNSYNSGMRYWASNAPTFTYNAPPIRSSFDITIKADMTQINNYHGVASDSYCAANGTKVSSDTAFSSCPGGPVYFTIHINVTTAQIQGLRVDASGNPGTGANFANDSIFVANINTPTSGRTDTAQPFGSTWNNLAANQTYNVTAADNVPGYKVVGSAWCDISNGGATACNNAGFSSNPKGFAGIGGHGGFQGGATRQIGPLDPGGNYDFRWVYQALPAGAPVVTVTCSSTDVLSGNAKDPDKAGALSLEFYLDAQAASNRIATGITSTNSVGDYSVDVSSFVPAGSTHTFYVKALGINSSGARDSKDGWGSYACTKGGSGPAAANCNGQNTQPTVNLPDAPVPSRGATGTTDQTGATTTASQQYYKEIPNDLHILDVYDQYGGPTHLNDNGRTGWSSTGWQSSPTFQLFYNEYVNQYPYDDHQTTVKYEQKYAETHFYTSAVPDYYTCAGSGNSGPAAPSDGNGHPKTCRHDYTGNADKWSCNQGDPGGGTSSTCTHNYTASYTYDGSCSATNTSGACTTWTCNLGDTGGGTSSTCTHSYPASYTYTGTAINWTCNGNYGGGSSSGCWYFYDGQPWYYWHNDPTTPYASMPITSTTYSGAQPLNECYKRNFTVQQSAETPSTDVTQVSFDNNESPTNVTINTRTAARFNLNHGITNLRHGMGVNGLNYTGYYYIEHANGSVVPLRSPDTQTQNVGGSVTNDGGSAQTTYSTGPIAVSLPPLLVGDKVCAQFTVDPAMGEIDEYGSKVAGTTSGVVNSTQIPSDPTCSAPLTNEPYARFYGNDVLAGAVFSGGAATCNTSAKISTYNTSSGVRPGGSGDQFAAMSLGSIQQFASAFLRGGAPTAPTGLSFANTVGGYGGNLGGACTKLPDFYGTKQPAVTVNRDVNAFSSIGIPPGTTAFKSPNGGTLSGAIIPTGSSVSLFVDGDVYITGNITFSTAGWTFDPLNRTTTVPSFYLIVNGNIDIAPGVTQLDGVYIAQPRTATAGGTIRTCSQASNAAFGANVLYALCSSQLTVNGSFIARDVKFDRTLSSLRHSVSGESPLPGSPGAHACDPSGAPALADCSAELFNFSPETYINMPALQPASSAKKNSYDFITTLSPVL